MNPFRPYKYAIAGLIALNLSILVFFLWPVAPKHHRPPHDRKGGPVVDLHLNDAQAELFWEMGHKHREKIHEIEDQQRAVLLPYFKALADTTLNVDDEQLLSDFQRLEVEKVKLTWGHFVEIRSILKKDQLPYFKDFTDRFIQNTMHGIKKPPPPPKDLR